MPIAESRIQADLPKLTAEEAECLEQFERRAEDIAARVRWEGGDLDSELRWLLELAEPTPGYPYLLHFCGQKRAACS